MLAGGAAGRRGTRPRSRPQAQVGRCPGQRAVGRGRQAQEPARKAAHGPAAAGAWEAGRLLVAGLCR